MPDTTHELVLGLRGKNLPFGSKVYLWESGGKDLVGVGEAVQEKAPRPQPEWQHQFSVLPGEPDPARERVVIRVDLRLDPPISRQRIQEDPVLAKAVFFRNAKNIQRTVCNVEPETAAALDNLIAAAQRKVIQRRASA